MACMAPEYSGPDLMGYDNETGCYFKKQPVTPEELERAIVAVEVSCIVALRYCGNNPEIIQKLGRVKEIDGEGRCGILGLGSIHSLKSPRAENASFGFALHLRKPAAIFSNPSSRRPEIATFLSAAIVCGRFPVRTIEASSPKVTSRT